MAENGREFEETEETKVKFNNQRVRKHRTQGGEIEKEKGARIHTSLVVACRQTESERVSTFLVFQTKLS